MLNLQRFFLGSPVYVTKILKLYICQKEITMNRCTSHTILKQKVMQPKIYLIVMLCAIFSISLHAQFTPANYNHPVPTIQKHFIQDKQKMNELPQMQIRQFAKTRHGHEPFGKSDYLRHNPTEAFINPDLDFRDQRTKDTSNTDDAVYVCDSALSYSTHGGMQRTEYTHDAKGRILVDLNQIRNSGSGLWVNDRQILYTYDVSGNMLTELYQYWNTETGNWINHLQFIYIYDVSGKRLTELLQAWDAETGTWVNRTQHSNSYDASGSRIIRLSQSWRTGVGKWVNSSQTLFTYDASGNMLSRFSQVWSIGISNWVNYYKYSYSYDASGNRLTELYQKWDTETGNWMNHAHDNYSWDVNGNMLTGLTQKWDTETGTWLNYRKDSYTYDASGNVFTRIIQDWNIEISIWMNALISECTYDATGNKLIELYQLWDHGISNWVDYRKIEFQYDYVNKKITALSYGWQGEWFPADDHPAISINGNWLFFGFYECYKIELWYDTHISGIEHQTAKSDFTNSFCSPNPATGAVTLSNPYAKQAQLKVFNVAGTLVQETQLASGQNTVSLQNLPQGIYLFVLQAGSSFVQNKVVVY